MLHIYQKNGNPTNYSNITLSVQIRSAKLPNLVKLEMPPLKIRLAFW